MKKTKTSKYLVSVLIILTVGLFMVSATTFSGCCIPINSLASSNVGEASVSEETKTSEQESTAETKETAAETEGTAAETEETAAQENADNSGYANNYSFYDLDNNKISFSDYAGKILVLNFWATWCSPCSEEIPDFAATYSEYKERGVQFLGISDDNIDSLNNYYKVSSINYPTLIDGSIDKIMTSWGIDAIPHTFILNGKGEIIFDQLGTMTREELINAIEGALQQQ